MYKSLKVKWICIISCLVVGIFQLPAAHAIKCYECNSHYNASCEEINNVSEQYVKDCSQKPSSNLTGHKNYTFCRKTILSINDKERIIRSCAYERHPKYECYYTTSIDVKSTVCQCFEDKCNDASIPKPTMMTMSLLFLSTVVLLFR